VRGQNSESISIHSPHLHPGRGLLTFVHPATTIWNQISSALGLRSRKEPHHCGGDEAESMTRCGLYKVAQFQAVLYCSSLYLQKLKSCKFRRITV
jgi:hypothetical protein